jgi:Carboxypeptidase regulatory-like domain
MFLLTASDSLFAQANLGRILGTVRDASGAVVPGVAVVIFDVDRGVERTLTSDDSGEYTAPSLNPGNKIIRATHSGFRTFEQRNIVLEVGQDARIDVALTPGDIKDVITVTETAPLLDTTSASLGGSLSNQTINDLPLNGRNYQNLLTLRPGVTIFPGGGGWTQSTNGLRAHDNVYMVDGLVNNEPWTGQSVYNAAAAAGDAGTILSIDAIQEFRTEQNPRAEFGWKPGSIVNVGIK